MKKILLALIIGSILIFCFVSCDNSCKHEYLDVTIIDQTCTEYGYTENRCIDCGYVFITDKTDPTGHTLSATTVDATCDTLGYRLNKCECGYEFADNYVTPVGHSYIDKVYAPACETQGYTTHTCSVCEFEYINQYVEATGHSYMTYTVEPTCISQGYTIYACGCGQIIKSDYKKPIAHILERLITAPTCTSEGYSLYVCDCGYSFKSDFLPPIEHNYISNVTIAPDCTNAGYTVYNCECGYTYTSDFVDALEHSYTTVTKKPTCSEFGYTEYTCKCGDTYISDIVSANGHDFSMITVNPTVSDMGYTDYTCEICNFNYQGNYRFYSEILPDGAYAKNDVVLAQGIDISKWNHTTTSTGEFLPLDWSAMKADGVDYVILKAGSTRSGKESTFELDYSGAKNAGVDVGIYFYTYSTTVAGIEADAQLLISILEGKSFEYPIYLDLEDDSLLNVEPSILTEMCVKFISILQENGYYAGLYVNHEWLYNILQTEKMLDMFEIWYARYPQNVTEYIWNTEMYGEHLGMWQYTDKGKLNAIPNIDIDFNFAYKDYPTIIKNLGLNGY